MKKLIYISAILALVLGTYFMWRDIREVKAEMEAVDPNLSVDFGGALPMELGAGLQELAKLPKYNAKCVDMLEAAQNGTTELSEFSALISCVNQLKSDDIYYQNRQANIQASEFDILGDNGLTTIIKGHQIVSQGNADEYTIRGKLIVQPTKQTILELKP